MSKTTIPDLSAIREELALELDQPEESGRCGRAVVLLEQLVAAMIAEADMMRDPDAARSSTEAKAS